MFIGTITGRVGQEVELRATASGVPLAKFSMASSTRTGDGKEQTTWMRIVAWRGAAETIAKYVRKGNQLSVSGRVMNNKWTDKDNVTRDSWELHVDQFALLSNGPRPTTDTETSETPESSDSQDFSDMA